MGEEMKEQKSITVKSNIRDIVKQWLKQHGYSGLCFPDMNCGCGFDDFMPCDNPDLNECIPCYEKIATKEDVENWDGEGELRVGDKFYVPIKEE